MNPDLEQRLRSGLSHEANALPGHDGSPQTAISAGRRRQTTRRLGTGLAAAALFFGGGGALWAQNQPSDPVDVVVADDGSRGITDAATAESEADTVTDYAEADAVTDERPTDGDPRTSFALALGDQVVVVDRDGYHDIVWQAPAGERLVMAQVAGETGVVIETQEQVLWLPTGSKEATVLKTEDQNLFLHDVAKVNGSWAAIWSEAPIDWESELFKGSSRLVAQDVETGLEFEIESYSWVGEGDDWKYYADATPLFENGPTAIVRSYNQGACHWIDPMALGGVMSAIATPLPRPPDPANDCTNPIITDIIAEAGGAIGPRLAYVTGDFFNEDVIVNSVDDQRRPVTFPVDELHSLLDFRDGRLRWAEIVPMNDGKRSLIVVEADVNLGSTREVWRIGLGANGVDENPDPGVALPNDLPEEALPVPGSSERAEPTEATVPPLATPELVELAMTDWKSYLRTVPGLTLYPSLEVTAERYPPVSDFYEVFDGRNGGYPIFDSIIYGDLDGDGSVEAVIPLDSGGTSLGVGALVFRSTEDGPQLVGPKSFYVRFGHKVWPTIENGRLTMQGGVGIDWEPTCCLSGEFTTTWKITDGELTKIASSETGVPEARGPSVERFYSFIAGGEFTKAYAMLSPAQQAREPFESWKAGFATTREIEVDTVAISGRDSVSFELIATDESADGTTSRGVFEGTWNLMYDSRRHLWLLDSFDAEQVGGEERFEPSPGVEVPSSSNPTDFVSPSGNITCSMTEDSVWCHIADKDWEISAPAGCQDDYGYVVDLTASGGAFGCYTDLFWDIDADPLAYGSSSVAGEFTCTMERTGVTCLNDAQEGFVLGRRSVSVTGDAASPDLQTNRDVGFGTWGPLRVGMSKAELAALDIGLFFEDDYISEGCAFAYFPGSDTLPTLMLVDDELGRIEFIDPAHRGPKGLSRASTEAEILAAYPNAVVTPHPYGFGADDNSHYVEVADPSGADRSFIFETDGTNVTAFRTGDLNINRWIEGCA